MALQYDKELANPLGKCFEDILVTMSLAAMPEWALSCKLHHTMITALCTFRLYHTRITAGAIAVQTEDISCL